jgi:hypothetical protein
MPITVDQLTNWCWKLAEQEGLSGLQPDYIAQIHQVSSFEVTRFIPSRFYAILLLFSDVTAKVKVSSKGQQPIEDYLFDIFMQYFDAASPHKLAIQKLWSDLLWNPIESVKILPHITKVINQVIDQAFPDSSWVLQEIRYKAFQLLTIQVFLTWLEDDSPDLAKTMAVLDQGIKRLQEYLGYLPFG